MTWVVIHEQAKQKYGLHRTKKAATAAAKEMQEAHEKAGALHNGQAITFRVEKRIEQEPTTDATAEESVA